MREMKQLGGDNVGVELPKSLWLQWLPKSTQAILSCADSGSLEVLTNTADQIHEVHARPVVSDVKLSVSRNHKLIQ